MDTVGEGGMPGQVLVATPAELLGKIVRLVLEGDGFAVTRALSGASVLAVTRAGTIDVVILDTALPESDGVALCQRLRAVRFPGVIVTLRRAGDPTTTVAYLEAGADDVIAIPFEPAELLARIRRLAARAAEAVARPAGGVVRVGDAELRLADLTYASAHVAPTLLAPTEARLLARLMRAAGTVVSRAALLRAGWGDAAVLPSNSVEVYIHRIRRKLECHPHGSRVVHTVRGGYVFRVAADPDLLLVDGERAAR
jgi:DNA-binding response OmpR family regulator